MKFTKDVEYAVKLVMYLDVHGKQKLETVAFYNELSLNMLEQVARKLRIAGIIKSIRGPGGGYELSKPSFSITYKELIDATNKSKKTNDLVFNRVEAAIDNALKMTLMGSEGLS